MIQTLLPDSKKESKVYDVVYNLYPFSPDLYLVNAFVVSKDKDGYLAHIKQKANKSTIEAYGVELTGVRSRLFEIIDRLQPPTLADKYKPPRRKTGYLEKLIADRDVKKKIFAYVHGLMDELLSAAMKYDFYVSWDVERKVLVKDFVLKLCKSPLKPHLFFEKTDSSVKYRFMLEDESGKWPIQSKTEIEPITNHPAWLFVDYHLCQVAHVNGNMVKPFRTKSEVIIPTESVRAYFQNFILKVASKVEIDAIGFDLLEENQLKGCLIEPVFDHTTEEWGLLPRMGYGAAEFIWNEKRANKTSLNFANDQNVQIVKINRDFDQECEYLEKIKQFGLVNRSGNYFELEVDQTADQMDLIGWLIAQKVALEKAGFEVVQPVLEERKLSLHKAELKIDVEKQNDWFDLFGDVVIGPFVIPFIKFGKHIREQNRFYILPNGNLFIIPLEWMTKFKALFQFGKRDENSIKLAKSQYTLLGDLDGLGSEVEMEDLPDLDNFRVSENLKATLRPYQMEGLRWLVKLNNNDLGGCLADDMGLGKTLQTIAVLLYSKENRPDPEKEGDKEKKDENEKGQLNLFTQSDDADWLNALNALIILPASLVFNWEKEIRHFAPSLSVYKHTGPKRHKDIKVIARFDVILTTYQTVLRDISILEQLEYEYIVLDESQQIKNKDSKMFKAINELQARHKLSLSGTPIENSLSDLWAQMHFINPNLLGNYNFFRREFIRPIEKFQDEEKKNRLRSLVKPYLLRRTKVEVAKELPPLTIRTFYSEMNKEQKKVYEREKSAVRNYLLENYLENNPKYRMMVLQSLTKLRQLSNHPVLVHEAYDKGSSKFTDVMEQWQVANKAGHKVLLFSSFVKYLELFRKDFDRRSEPYSWLTGALNSRKREQEVRKFEETEEIRSFFISIKSGGTGLNLTAADYVFILDPWWNPFTEQQAIARAHRIGQDKNVIAYKFITKDTIEEKILRLQEKKTRLAEDIIEHVQKASFSKGDIEFLLD